MFAAVLHAPDIDVEVVDVREGTPAPCSAEGYVITGSRYSVYDDLPWIPRLADFLRIEIDAGKKVVGICFGHQLLAHFFGGEVRPAPVGWEVGVKETEVCAPQDWMKPAVSTFNLISSHKDQVLRLPEGAVLTARSPFCPVAGFALGDNVITFQGHPEFRKDYSQTLMAHRRELLGEEKYVEGVRSLERPTDEDLVGRWILSFLRSRKKSGRAETS
jgi:GMP synthase-like glutamine amidotransferase